MSLATRCTACGTVFRVVQDQLKVSEGWVRCGRCNEVFNALESLFDLDHDVPPAWPASAGDTPFGDAGVAPHSIDLDPTRRAPSVVGPDDSLVDRIDSHVFGMRPAGAQADGNAAASARVATTDAEPLAFTHRSADDDDIGAASLDPPAPPAAPAVETAPAPPAPAAPEFIRQAERQARLRDPRARAVLGLAATLLVALLALQAAHQFRDTLAARWPATGPALAAWCERAGCSLRAPRRIDALSVENTSLTRAGEPDSFRLALTLRNRGGLALALPNVDLSLTDVAGKLVARRALTPEDFRVDPPLIAAGAEAPLQVLLSAGSPRVTGYTVEIFYP